MLLRTDKLILSLEAQTKLFVIFVIPMFDEKEIFLVETTMVG